MDFDFSEKQDALREAVRTTLAAELGPERLRELVSAGRPGVTVPDRLWRHLVDLGWTGVLVPEELGGLGLGLVDLVVVLEEMGKLPLPGPFLASAGLATRAAVLLGADDLLRRLASGEVVGTVALEESSTADDPLAAVTTTARRTADGWVLDGLKPLVLDGHVADVVLVVARDDEGIAGFQVTGRRAELVPTLDPTRAMGRLVLDGQPAVRLGPAGDQMELWARFLDDGAVMLAAESVGACDRVFALTTDYAKTRVQFDRPIGSFQAVKHLAADMLQDLTLARVGVHYAAWASDTDHPGRAEAAAMAKSWTGEASVRCTGTGIQVHGGVGFTWDALIHLHFKRAKTNDLLLGRQGWHRRRVADLVLGPVA